MEGFPYSGWQERSPQGTQCSWCAAVAISCARWRPPGAARGVRGPRPSRRYLQLLRAQSKFAGLLVWSCSSVASVVTYVLCTYSVSVVGSGVWSAVGGLRVWWLVVGKRSAGVRRRAALRPAAGGSDRGRDLGTGWRWLRATHSRVSLLAAVSLILITNV